MTASFQSSSLGWQVQKLSQQASEWIEFQLYRLRPPDVPTPDLPTWPLPVWLTRSVFITLATLLTAWLLWQVYQLLRPYLAAGRSRPTNLRTEGSARKRQLSANQWWQRALQLQRQGNYGEACRALYLGMLQTLQDQKRVAEQPSITDGEYRDLLLNSPDAAACQVLLETHEQLMFGDGAATEDTFERCQTAYREIASP